MSDSTTPFEVHIPVESENHMAIDLLAQHVTVSRQQIKQAMLKGAVWLSRGKKTQRLRRAKKILKKGESIHCYFDSQLLSRRVDPPTLIADLGRYSVWQKPYNMLSQGSQWGDHCSLLRWAEQHLSPKREAFLVHRLDRAANGLMIVAHDKQAAASLSALFHDRRLDKRYRITVYGHFDETATQSEPVTVSTHLDGKPAVSHFSFESYQPDMDCSVLNVRIETGRKHQIRRHSQTLGFPIVGDSIYGVKADGDKLQLSAYRLAFICPLTGVSHCFELPQ